MLYAHKEVRVANLRPLSPIPRPWAPVPGSLTQPSSENKALRGGSSNGEKHLLGFNEIIYCLFALTKIVNVTGEI